MDVWTFLWLMVFLKIPIVGLFMIVRWAVREPETAPEGGSGGSGDRSAPRHPHRSPRRPPRGPRRGPHGECSPSSPPRVRSVLARQRLPRV